MLSFKWCFCIINGKEQTSTEISQPHLWCLVLQGALMGGSAGETRATGFSAVPPTSRPRVPCVCRSTPASSAWTPCKKTTSCPTSSLSLPARKVSTPSPKQPFSFLGQPAINSARHARELFSSVPAGVWLCCLWQCLADSTQWRMGLHGHLYVFRSSLQSKKLLR